SGDNRSFSQSDRLRDSVGFTPSFSQRSLKARLLSCSISQYSARAGKRKPLWISVAQPSVEVSMRFDMICRRLCGTAFLLILLTTVGCDPAGNRADLVILNGAEPESIDPAVVTGQLETRICYALFEGLLHFDRFGKPPAGVAESWDLSNNGKTYTFHLRANVKWSNGDPVTAGDFARSWERALLPETASEYAYLLYHIRNARGFNEGKLKDFGQVGIAALDDRTLRVDLEAP